MAEIRESSDSDQDGSVSNFSAFIQAIKGVKEEINQLSREDAISIFDVFNEKIKEGAQSTADYLDILRNTDETIANYLQSVGDSEPTFQDYVSYCQEAIDANDQLSLSAKVGELALKGLAMAGNMFLTWAITKVIELAAKAIYNFIHRVDIAKDALDEFNSEIETRRDTYKSHADLVDKVSESYENLASKVDTATNTNLDLSEEEYSEFLSITNEIAESFPTLVKGFDDSGNAILDFGDDCENSTEKLKELLETEKQLTNVKIASELPEYFKNIETVIKDYDKQISQFQNKINELNNTKIMLNNISTGDIDLFKQNKFSVDDLGAKQYSELHNLLNKSLSEFVDGLSSVEKLNLGNLNLGVNDFIKSDGQNMWLDLVNLNSEQRTELEAIIKDNINMLSLTVNDELSNARMSLNQAESSKESSWKDFTQNLVSGMNSKASFQALSAEGQQLATALVQGLDSGVAEDMDDLDPYKYVQENIVSKLSGNNAQEITNAYAKLLVLNPEDLSESNQTTVSNLISSLSQMLGMDENKLRISLGFEIDESSKERYEDLVGLFGKNAVEKLTPEDLEIAYTISSEQANKAIEEEKNKIKTELESLSKEGNVDLTIRPVIDSSAMQAAGWDVEDGSIATTFTQGEFIWQGDEENGQYVYVHYTPILHDGTVLTPDELTDYLYGTLESSQNILEADNKGIVLKVDTDLQGISEEDIKKFQNGEGSTSAIDGLIKKTGEWDDKVHSVQGQYYSTGDSVYYVTNALARLIQEQKKSQNINTTNTLLFSQQISQIQALSKGLDQLDTIMADIIEGEDFDYSSILNNEGFIEAFGQYKEEYENFIETITNSPDDISKCKSAFDELATAYVYGSGALADLTEESKDAAILELTQMGVANATEVVNSVLEKYSDALEIAEAKSFDLANATTQNISDFIEEQNVIGTSGEAFFYYALQKQLASDTGLSTTEECQQLINLANQTIQTAEILEKFINILNVINSDSWGDATKELAKKELQKMLAELSTVDVDFKNGQKTKASMAEAGKDAAEEYKEALEKELSDLDTVLNFITDTIQDQIDVWNDAKDAAVDALEAERDAAIEALEAEKALVQEKIDAKQKEIDKIKEAREERSAEIDLQKKQYDLERLQNQQTQLIYKDGQMVYTRDEAGIRDAREQVDEAKENIKILQIEKEISALEDVIDSLDKQIDSVNDHYDKLIEQTEKYFENLIKGLEEYKSRWEEIGELEEQAKIQVALEKLGFKTEDILNMSGDAFDQFKQRYLEVLKELYSGEAEMSSIFGNYVNTAQEELSKMNELGSDAGQGFLEGWGEKSEEITSATRQTASDAVDAYAEGQNSHSPSEDYKSLAHDAIDGLIIGIEEKKQEFIDSVKSLAQDGAIAFGEAFTSEENGLANSFDSLKLLIDSVAQAIGIGEEGTVGSLLSALSALSSFSLGEGETGIIGQFNALKSAIDEVTSAISGGGSKANEGGGLATGANGGAATPDMSGDGEGSGLTGAIKEIGTATDETLGMAGESSEEGEGVLGKFGQFKTAVDEVTKAIGTGEEDKEEEMSLISALKKHYEVAEETVPEVKGFFDELLSSISACVAKLGELAAGISALKTGGEGGSPVEFAAKGTSHAKKGLYVVGEEAPELIEDTKGNLSLATKPTLLNMKGGEKVYNGDETEKLLTPLDESNYPYAALMKSKSLLNAGTLYPVNNTLTRQFDGMMSTMKSVQPLHNASQNINLTIGDIQLQGVQDVNGLANAITTKLPNTLLQTMTKRK